MTKVLIIDDVPCATQLRPHLRRFGFEIVQELDADRGVAAVAKEIPDLVLLDLHFPKDRYDSERTTGGRLHTTLRREFPDIPVLIFSTRTKDNKIALEQLEIEPLGRIDKPDRRAAGWVQNFANLLKQAITAFEAEKVFKSLDFHVGRTLPMRQLAQELCDVAPECTPVLLRGEAGVGKRFAAEALHRLGRRTGRLVVLDKSACGTDGKPRSPAEFVAEADGGTLLLVRYEEFDTQLLASLSGVIQGLETGSKANLNAGVRIVATSRLERGAQQEAALTDLFSGLRRCDLWVPALRERLEDLPALFSLAVDSHNKAAAVPKSRHFRPETQAVLACRAWPDNIREFSDAIHTAARGTLNETLLPSDFSWLPGRSVASGPLTSTEQGKGDDRRTALARAAFNLIHGSPPGTKNRFKIFKEVSEDDQPLVIRFIINHLRETKKMETVKRDHVTFYLLGDKVTINDTPFHTTGTYLSRDGKFGKAIRLSR